MKQTQHVRIPNDMTLDGKLTPTDVLVYAVLKSYMNGKSYEAFPSIKTLATRSGLSANTITKSLAVLEDNNEIKIIKSTGRSNRYLFNPHSTNFEMFTYDFLLKDDLTAKQKAYLLVSQQYMYKEGNNGNISFSDIELGSKIGMSPRLIRTRNEELVDKNILTVQISPLRDETGLFKEVKSFNLEMLGQAILFLGKKVVEHDERLDSQEEKLRLQELRLQEQEQELKKLKEIIWRELRV